MTTKQIEFELYQYWRSSCSWRVRWALLHKGLQYQSLPTHLVQGDQLSPNYLKMNPNAKVPTIVVNGEYLTQSLSIIEWIEETYPEKPLLPKDRVERQKVRALAQIIACDTQPVQNFSVLKRIESLGGNKVAWAKQTIEDGLAAFEATLELYQCSEKGNFSFGDTLTIADLCLIPQCYNANRFGVDLKNYPRISSINTHCLTVPECQKAAPEAQVDAAK